MSNILLKESKKTNLQSSESQGLKAITLRKNSLMRKGSKVYCANKESNGKKIHLSEDKLHKKYQRISHLFDRVIQTDREHCRTLKKIKTFMDDYIHILRKKSGVTERSTRVAHPIAVMRKIPSLNLSKLSSSDFHQEFLKNVPDFSDSWLRALKEGR